MIWHQTIGPNIYGENLGVRCKKFEVGFVIMLMEESLLTPIPTLCHVMRNVRDNDACDSYHNGGGQDE